MLPDRVSLTVHHRGRADPVTVDRSRPLVVGRASPSDVIVEDSQVSRRHVQFELLDDGLWVEDLGSKNGTVAGGQRIGRRRLSPGEDVRFGSVVVVPGLPRRGRRRAAFETYERFLERAEDELERARVFGRPFSLLFLRAGTVSETPSLEAGALRSVDRVSMFAPTMLLVALPERAEAAAAEVASQLTASIGEGASCGVAEYPSAGATAEELVAAARRHAFRGEARPPARVTTAFAELVAESAAMRGVLERARELSGSAEPVVLFGEVGTGKALVARAIHEESARSGGLSRVRCGDARSSDFSAVLSAALESCRRGTIFLDEIGALTPDTQETLARALETATGVRVIAATSDDLDARAREGAIRPDLLRALDAARVTIPPLRHRRDDLRVLAQRFLDDAARVDDGAARAFDETAMQALLSYAWPGNARELKSVVTRASALAAGRSVTAIDLPQPVRNATAEPVRAASAGEAHDVSGATLKELVQSYEKRVIERALDAAGGKRADAARALGLPLRTLAHKIASLGIGRRR